MERTELSRASAFVGIAVATAVGLSVRLRGLGEDGFWLDELGTGRYIAHGVSELATGARLDPGHPPLYYIVLRLICGPGASDVALRLPSVIAGAATIPLAALLAAALFGRRTALATAALVASSPFLVAHSQEARMYALLALLTTASSLCAWRTLRAERPRAAVAYAVLATATVLTHFLGAAACLAQLIAAPVVARSRRGLRLFLVAALAAATTFLLLWGWHLQEQLARDPIGWCEPSSWSGRARTLAAMLLGGENAQWSLDQPAAAVALAVVITAGSVIGCALVAFRDRRLASAPVFAALLVLVPVGGLLAADLALQPALIARYLTAGVVPLLVIIAAAAVRVPRVGWLVLTLLVCAQLAALRMQEASPAREHWREAGEFVSTRLEEGDIVFAATRNVARYLPSGTRISTPWRDWQGENAARGTGLLGRRAWVIRERHLSADLELRGLGLTGNPLLRKRFFDTEVVLLDAPAVKSAGASAEDDRR